MTSTTDSHLNGDQDWSDGATWYVAGEDEEAGLIEIVDEIVFDEPCRDEPSLPVDPFDHFVAAAESAVDVLGGTADCLKLVRGLLGAARLHVEVPSAAVDALSSAGLLTTSGGRIARSQTLTEQVSAWKAVLSGQNDDLSSCGSRTLDEWAAELLVSVLGGRIGFETVRRELRRQGVAAFGVVVAA